MNARQTQAIAVRAASLLASMVVTALIVGSQLGIADGYRGVLSCLGMATLAYARGQASSQMLRTVLLV